ncbi:IspD/TarI family cytidylyltransferase [Lactiplantibacillus mudanjiangensis]|uniref:Ribitol-5-phosphate cytidylyltransferase n=1 Tax=Lactiplantibacillus mudanjiangensis TaxID=1296538 RepID=A0A660E4W0_9LACO|nr:2-C-methyl-D-erythritol 4-phosphate cytidylyltransferase [Lactiplantibacillus mudanjiangensis]VDG19432.1 2-C-methyl-D-erythritol 4-phosphate cytidylyltransferase [Lactobacillus plantarum JDM1] [Lactiplantibacillus mudanjiangensis]VDG24997.1 2-C-methyl-D-erythritol 4-phosphate cytidylyltransferase [Lactobacillus plantarum JDM1] [Lactiplantibacillus mudanjiangensis]VDG27989.1 2-C-methyl-D-erythritol 4-phosphate cytidylyltransferase [Lactobacillus plantarum JDM1] [Lactiplantibacillus mudanjiange
MIFAQILAGGKGTRMGHVQMPKQFLTLADKPILIHTVEKFVLESRFEAILIVCPPAWLAHTQAIVKRYLHDDRVKVVTGGADRNDTLMHGIAYLQENYDLTDDDVVITHDAVRPFITQRIIADNITAVLNHSAVDTVVPAIDTIVEGEDEAILNIPIREAMYQGQTPQSFNIKTLVKAYDQLTTAQKATLSDSCKICLLAGEDVHLVRGENFNFKITTPYDLKVATALVETRD